VPPREIFQADAQRAGQGWEHRPAPGCPARGGGHLQVPHPEPGRQNKPAE
jgi:hypothetical protein